MLDDDCAETHQTPEEALQCLSTYQALLHDFIDTPVFVHQDQRDPKIFGLVEPGDPNFEMIIDSTAATIRGVLEERDGVFSPAANYHVILNEPRFKHLEIPADQALAKSALAAAPASVDSFSMADVLGNWYFNRNAPTRVIAAPLQDTSAVFDYQARANKYQIKVDGITRELIVYVPTGYDPNALTPLVFMFHGTGQDGETMFQVSGWPEKCSLQSHSSRSSWEKE